MPHPSGVPELRSVDPPSSLPETNRPTILPARILMVGAGLWFIAIVAAPLFHQQWIYTFFSGICHQNPDRSWFLAGEPLAVCVRCTSIYAGFLIAMISRVPPSARFLKTAVVLTLTEFLVAQLGFDFEVSRSLTGLLLGLATAGFVDQGVRELVRERLARVLAGAASQ